MKNLLALLATVLAFNLSNAQSWTKSSGGNSFDGRYKTSSVQGSGTDYPYTKPLLVINKFDEGNVNFYVTGSGYWTDTPTVMFVFDNEPNVKYVGIGQTTSKDSKIVFFEKFKGNNETISSYEVMDKIRKASKLYVRISGNYGKNDLSFSLRGSTNAINYVLPTLDKLVEDEKAEAKATKERDSVLSFHATKILKPAKINKIKDYDRLLRKLKRHIEIGVDDAGNKFFEDGVAMEVRPKKLFKEYGFVTLYLVFPDGTEELFDEYSTVEMDSPLFKQ